jgi:hypothetical protein
VVLASFSMARPKSEITRRPSIILSTFCGVTSRWMIPTAWMAANPAQIARASASRSASGRRGRGDVSSFPSATSSRSNARRLPPAASSIVTNQ